ncbi:MAG: hypothetical protein QXO86_01310 [Nitrososphaerota archaeon]
MEPYFRERAEKGRRNERYYRGEQWTEEERRVIAMQNRYPYVFNEIFHKVDHLLGVQLQTRLDVAVKPMAPQYDMSARLLEAVINLFDNLNSIDVIESEIFQDMLIYGIGAARVSWSWRDTPTGYVAVERVHPVDLLWDLNAIQRNLADARWMARILWVPRADLVEMYPEHASVIADMPSHGRDWGIEGRIPFFPTNWKGSFDNATPPMQYLPYLEYYERLTEWVYVVTDRYRGERVSFEKAREAEEYARGLSNTYADAGKTLYDELGFPMIIIDRIERSRYALVVAIGNKVVEARELDIPTFPFVVAFAYFLNGEYWSLVDNLVDPQIFVNRFLSEWDYQTGAAAKNLVTVQENLLRRGMTYEHVRAELSRRSPVLPVISHDAIRAHPSQHPLPELFQGVSFGIQRMNEYMGGRNFMGLQESAAESGRAIIARAEQAGLARLRLFENLKLWRKQVTEIALWYIRNFLSVDDALSLVGWDEMARTWLDTGVLDTLKEVRVEVEVDEAYVSKTYQERMFQLLREYFATVGAPPEIAMPMLLKYSPLPEKDKQEILAMSEFYREYMLRRSEVERQKKIKQAAQEQVEKALIRHNIARSLGLQTRPQRLTAEEILGDAHLPQPPQGGEPGANTTGETVS